MMMENLEEWRLAGETEVLGRNPPQRHFVHHKTHLTRPGLEPLAAALGSQRLTAWAMAWPFFIQKLGTKILITSRKFTVTLACHFNTTVTVCRLLVRLYDKCHMCGCIHYVCRRKHETDAKRKVTGKPWFPGLTLKMQLNWDLCWNKSTLYITITALLKHFMSFAFSVITYVFSV
jgi:hypothetical protein